MNRTRTLALALVALGLIASTATAQVPAELRAAMGARDSAITNIDANAWDRLTASTFTVVQEDGVMMSKAERLAQFRTEKPTTFAPRTRESVVRHGDAYLGRYLRGGFWILELWVREDGRWKAAAVQVTAAKQ